MYYVICYRGELRHERFHEFDALTKDDPQPEDEARTKPQREASRGGG
jgi:hypothetical protein